MRSLTKNHIIFGLIIMCIVLMTLRSPDTNWGNAIRYLVLFNTIIILILWGSIRLRLYYHYRDIEQIINMLHPFYQETKKPYMSVIFHKKQIMNPQAESYLMSTEFEPSSEYHRFEVFSHGKVYEFITYIHHTQIPSLSAVIVSYLKKDIPYERLYEDIRNLYK